MLTRLPSDLGSSQSARQDDGFHLQSANELHRDNSGRQSPESILQV